MARFLRREGRGLGRGALAVALVVVGVASLLAPGGPGAGAQENVETNATIRVVHASPGAPNVDVLLDGQPLVEDLPYGSVTDYVPLAVEEHQLQVVPTGQDAESAVIDEELDAETGRAYIFVIRGALNEIAAERLEVNLDTVEEGKARARLIHAAADAGDVDVAVTGGDTLFEGIGFEDESDYEEIDPGTYSFDVRGEEDRILATVPELTFEVGRVYDLIAIGQVSDQSLQLLALVTNVSQPCTEVLGLTGGIEDACVRIVHAATGAPDVDVYVNDSQLLAGLTFGAATEYVSLPAGDDRQVQIVAAGTSVEEPLVESEIGFEPGQAYQIVATGSQDEIEATVNEVNLTPVPESQSRIRLVHASPDAGAVDLGIADGEIVFEDIDFRDASDYAVVDAGAYTLEVHPAGEDTVTLQADADLTAGTVYDVFAVGREDDSSLAVLVLASQASVREGAVATPGADTLTTPGALGTVEPESTDVAGDETDAVDPGEETSETAVSVEGGPTETPVPEPTAPTVVEVTATPAAPAPTATIVVEVTATAAATTVPTATVVVEVTATPAG